MNRLALLACALLLACRPGDRADLPASAARSTPTEAAPTTSPSSAPAAPAEVAAPSDAPPPAAPSPKAPPGYVPPVLGQAELHRLFPPHPAALTSIVPMGGERTVAHGIPMTLAYFETWASPATILEFYVRHFRAMHWSYIGAREAAKAVPHPAVSATDPKTLAQMSVMVMPGDAQTPSTVFLAIADVRPEARVHQGGDLPAYPGATPLAVSTLEGSASSETVAFTTPDKPEAVAAFLRENFLKQGWKEMPSQLPPQSDLRTLGFVRNGSSWQVTLATAAQSTAVTAIRTGQRPEEDEEEEPR